MLQPETSDRILDHALLLFGKCHHSERSLRMKQDMLPDELHTPVRFRDIAPVPVNAVFHQHILDPAVRLPAASGKCDQLIPVDLPVRKCDQGLIPAPVMPQEHAGRKICGGLIKNGLADRFVIELLLVPVKILSPPDRCGKEARRRHLSGISRDNDLFSPADRADCVLRKDLRSLIEDDHIKCILVRIQKIGDRER